MLGSTVQALEDYIGIEQRWQGSEGVTWACVLYQKSRLLLMKIVAELSQIQRQAA